MNFTKAISIRIKNLRKQEMCPAFLNICFPNYSIMHCLNDVLAGAKIFLLLSPLLVALSVLCGGSPVHGLVSGLVAIGVSVLLGGSTYQISSIAFPICILALELSVRYQYKGLLIASFVTCLTLYVFGKVKISEVLRFVSSAFLTSIITYVAIIVLLMQTQYLLGISVYTPYHNIFDNVTNFINSLQHVSVSGIYNLIFFVLPLMFLKLFFKGHSVYFIYLVLCSVIFYLNDLKVINYDILYNYKTIGKDFFDGLVDNNIFTITYTLPPQSSLTSIANFGFAIAVIIAAQASFCTNITSSLTGNTRTQTNMELISSGIANFVSISCGGLFVAPNVELTLKNIQLKAKSLIPLLVVAGMCVLGIFYSDKIFRYVPMYSISAILIVYSISAIINSDVKKYLFNPSKETYVFLSIFLIDIFFGFILAAFIGFMVSLIIFAKRMVNIKDAAVYSTRNHDASVSEFMSCKYGYINNKRIPTSILNKIEVIQINNVLFLNLLKIIKETLVARGNFPSAIIIYFKNIPYLDGEALNFLKEFTEECSKMDCIVVLSGTNGILFNIIQNKNEYNIGNGYVIPNFDDAISQIIKRFTPSRCHYKLKSA